MRRRSFLRHVSHSIAIPSLLSSIGMPAYGESMFRKLMKIQQETGQVLVIIFLEGGNDGLNTVIPLNQLSTLNQVRPHVILPENKLINLANTELALHPSLQNFNSLYNEGRLRIVQNVGYPDQNFSHFRSTDIWMSGSASNQYVNSGWSGRYLHQNFPTFPIDYPNETTPHPLAIEMGFGSSLLFQGPTSAMSMVISDPREFYELVENQEVEAPDTPAGEQLRFVRLIAKQSQQYGEIVTEAAQRAPRQQPYPQSRLAQQLQIVSRLISGGLETPLYLVRLGGFDTHDAQVEASDHTTGEHADLLKTLDEAVMAFLNDLEAQGNGDRVLGMTFSEFGRRIVSNASLGTDHGAAAPLFFFGNKVKGGIEGKNPIISADATYGDNLEMEYDFRQVYGSVMEQWFQTGQSERDDVLLDDFATIPVIGEADAVTGLEDLFLDSPLLEVYPNPVQDQFHISFQSDGSFSRVYLVDVLGREVAKIHKGIIPKGNQNLKWNSSKLKPGQYFLIIENNKTRHTKSILK